MAEKSEFERASQATVRRHFHEEQSAIFAHGDFRVLFESYLEYVRPFESLPDPLGQVMMRQALGAACLHLACRPNDETVAWTLNVKSPATNLFVSGDGDGDVVGRCFGDGVKTSESSRLFVESFRTGGAQFKSTIEIDGIDVLEIFEQYYTQSVQTHVRFLELTDHEFVMVLGLPMTDGEWIRQLDRDQVVTCLNGPLKFLDEKSFQFRCRCDKKKIVETVFALFAGKLEEFFEGEDVVEASCPRCARKFDLRPPDFEEVSS